MLVRYRRRPGSLSADEVWMCSNAIRVLHKMRTAIDMTDGERSVLEEAIMRFEGKRAFISGDVPTAIDRLQRSTASLSSFRVTLIVLLIRTVPTFARTAYVWRSRLLGE